MSKALESGKSFLSGVLAKLPEDLRNKPLSEILAATEASEFLTSVGDGALARSDYSRYMDDLKKKEEAVLADHQKLTDWWNGHQDYDQIKAERDRLKAGGGAPPADGGDPPADPKYIDVETFNKIMQETQQSAVAYMNTAVHLTTKHLHQFGEVIDPNELVQLANQKRVTILDAYQQKYGEKIEAAQKKAEEDRINKLVEDRVAEERRKHPEMPFPLRNQSPSVLDSLTPDRNPAEFSVDAAVAEYNRLQSARG